MHTCPPLKLLSTDSKRARDSKTPFEVSVQVPVHMGRSRTHLCHHPGFLGCGTWGQNLQAPSGRRPTQRQSCFCNPWPLRRSLQHLTTVRSGARIQTQVHPVPETAQSWARRRVDLGLGLPWELVAHSRGDKPAASGSSGPKTSLPWCVLYLKFISNLLFIVGKYT